MAANIASSFIDQWGTETKLQYQQKKSNLRNAVTVRNNVTGATSKFHKMGTVTANTKTRGADLTPLDPTQGIATATLADKYAGIYINDLDECKTNADVRRGYVESGAAALQRDTDNIIIAAADLDNTAITTTNGAFTYARFLEVMTGLNEQEVDPENRVLVVKPKQLEEAMAITQFTNSDYLALNAVRTGMVGDALGFKWIISNRVSTDATGGTAGAPADRCYGFSKTAIGLAVGKDIQTRIDWSTDKQEHFVVSKMSMGSVVIENTGVIQMLCDQ